MVTLSRQSLRRFLLTSLLATAWTNAPCHGLDFPEDSALGNHYLRRELDHPDQQHNYTQGIVSGQTTNARDYPWYAKFDGRILCGGTLVGDGNFVLTAAHCVDDGYTPFQVRVGTHFLNEGGTVLMAVKKFIHPNFTRTSLGDDVALLKVARSCFCHPPSITLNSNPNIPETSGQDLTVIGFGRTSNGGGVAGALQSLVVDYLTNDDCRTRGGFNEKSVMCADLDGGGPCQGDSGSPLLLDDPNTGEKVQVGIVSYGKVGCASEFPDYYTRVSSHIGWIQSTIDAELNAFGPDRMSIVDFMRMNGPSWMQSSLRYLFGS